MWYNQTRLEKVRKRNMQTTEKLYDKDSYLQEFQATVVSCEQKDETTWKVVLDKTSFLSLIKY